MRVYLAGMLQTGLIWGSKERAENVMLTEDIRRDYPWDLESYHYAKDIRDIQAYLRHHKKTIFLDSGAFSMFTQKVKVSLADYADYIKANKSTIHVASNLDEIGANKEQESWNNQKTLERMGATVAPVHHIKDDDKWLLKYMAEGYDYIFLGGMVGQNTTHRRGWLDHIFSRYLTKKNGEAKIKLHGFGCDTAELMWRYPWFSVDSTGWVKKSRFGQIYIDLPHKDMILTMSSDSPKRKNFDQHFTTLDPVTQRAVRDRIEELGYSTDLLQTHYGWRDHFNIAYFERLLKRPTPKFVMKEPSLF